MRFGSLAMFASFLALLAVPAACSSTTIRSVDLSDAGGSTTADSGGGKDGGGNANGTLCEKTCANSASANCAKASSCVADCEADMKKIPEGCKEEADALQTCGSTATTFKCSSSGKAVVDGACDDEGGALLQCITSGGKPDAGPTGCGNISFGKAQCDACVKNNCCAQNAACSASTECMAILDCFETCTSNACYTQCENAHPAGKATEQAFYGCIQPTCNADCQ